MPQPVALSISAIENVVSRHIRTNAEVIVVRRINDRFGGQLAIPTRQHGDHVVRFEIAESC